MPRRKRSTWSFAPAGNPLWRERVERALSRTTIVIPQHCRAALVEELAGACEERAAGVNVGKLRVTNKSTANGIFMHDVKVAMERAGLQTGRWSERESGKNATGRESDWYTVSDALAVEFDIALSGGKRRVAEAADTIKASLR